jgi:hypothetical protein
MIEWIVILVIILCIVAWYYSQSVPEYSISQIKEVQIPVQLTSLWEERKPVVVSDVRPQEIWLANSLKQTRFWGAQKVWEDYEQNPAQTQISVPYSQNMAWAEILGIGQIQKDILLRWFDLSPWVFSVKTEAHIGYQGLRPTFGWATAFTCTQGTARCILLHSAQKGKMPGGWLGLPWRQATVAHHPLWTQVQFIEVVLRPGTTLLVPPHWIVAIEPSNPSEAIWWIRSDLHHPISALAQRLNEKGSKAA